MMKPTRWIDPKNKLFPHQVDFTAPHGFDAAPSDFALYWWVMKTLGPSHSPRG